MEGAPRRWRLIDKQEPDHGGLCTPRLGKNPVRVMSTGMTFSDFSVGWFTLAAVGDLGFRGVGWEIRFGDY